MVAYQCTPEGIDVVAVGPEEVGQYLRDAPAQERVGVVLGRP
jgi:hypothetical protein